jgi:hypothetical protein
MIRKHVVAVLVGAALQAAAPAWAQQQPQGKPGAPGPTTPSAASPASPAPPGTSTTPPASAPTKPGSKQAYEVAGFRSAKFGMTEAEVKAAIQKDFGVKPEDIRSAANAMERTTALMVPLPTLDPGPGPATAVYILGYQSKKLIQVNVVWAPDPGKTEKADTGPYVVAGVQLSNYFNGFGWRDGGVNVGMALGPHTLALFAGEDDKTGAVNVVVDGVSLERRVDGKVEPLPPPTSPPSLRVSYIANRITPDIFRLERGRF